MHKSIGKVVQEYILFVEALEFSIKGRVSEQFESDSNQRYSWSISHHYRPSATAAGVYYPSATLAPTFKKAEALLLRYMKGFTALDVTANEY